LLETFLWLSITVVSLGLAGCAKPPSQPPTRMEEPAPPIETPTPEPTPEMLDLPPPQPSEVQDAVKRIFQDVALIEPSIKPGFIVGDFNGDFSQDLVVALKPAPGKLDELNDEFAIWIRRDPFDVTQSQPGPMRVENHDLLLAVIHGYGPMGWRDPQATQTYLLRNPPGAAIKPKPAKEFISENKGKRIPGIKGDLIKEDIPGSSGFLYYTGSSYAWYHPKAFKAEAEKQLIHGGGMTGGGMSGKGMSGMSSNPKTTPGR
jgi:hypothetical protein